MKQWIEYRRGMPWKLIQYQLLTKGHVLLTKYLVSVAYS